MPLTTWTTYASIVIPSPGTWLVFSSAHFHGNISGALNVDVRLYRTNNTPGVIQGPENTSQANTGFSDCEERVVLHPFLYVTANSNDILAFQGYAVATVNTIDSIGITAVKLF